MNIQDLENIPSWEWPAEAAEWLLEALRDPQARHETRLSAAGLAGEMAVVNEDLARELLKVVTDPAEAEDVRCEAAIALGPGLETCDTELTGSGKEFLEDTEDVPFGHATFDEIRRTLRALFEDTAVPSNVRRRALEAAVRALQPWQTEAVRAAYNNPDLDWKVTAVFCMRYIQGFEKEILKALRNRDQDLQYEAVRAAGAWGLEEAFEICSAIAVLESSEKHLRIAAIQAMTEICPEDAGDLLMPIRNHRDKDIAEAVEEAIDGATLSADLFPGWDEGDDDDEDDDWDDDDEDDDDDDWDEDEDEDGEEDEPDDAGRNGRYIN